MARQFKPGQLQTGSLYNISSSYALTASYALNAGGGAGSGFPFSGSAVITGSLVVSGSGITGNLTGTSSYAIYAETASFSTTSQNILVYVKNQSGNAIAKGVVVRITGSNNSSDIPRIVTASYGNEGNSANTLGITNQSISDGSEGYVMTEGVLTGIDTTNFDSGQLIYLGPAGSIIGYAPVAPLHAVRLGEVIRQQSNNGSIYVRIDNGYELDELHNVYVNTSSLSSGDLLVRSGSVWTNTKQLTGSYSLTGSLDINGNITATSLTGSLLGTASYASTAAIQYVTNSIQSLTGIEIADFDSNTAVTFTNGVLKFIFGTPTAPSAPTVTFNSTFATDRFNKVLDTYDITGSWSVGGYTLVSASLWEGGTNLAYVTSGTTLLYNTTTSGSHTYRLQVTASSPLDGTLNMQSTTLTGTLSKTNPGSPTITPTATVQLGATSNQIEQGATGSITFTSASGATNSWVHNYTSTNVSTPIFITGSATGSASISTTVTSYYSSSGVNGSDNSPALTTTSTNSFTYTKIRSLRYGATGSTSFTSTELENLALWDTTLGGSVGTIAKGTTTATGQTITITWTGDKYHYIAYNSSLASLTNITTAGFGVLGSFTLTTVGNYKVYRSNTLQAGGAGTSITYALT